MSNWDLSEINLRKVYDYCIRRGMQIDNMLGSKDISRLDILYSSISHEDYKNLKQILGYLQEIKAINAKTVYDSEKKKNDEKLVEVESILTNTTAYSTIKKSIRKLKRCLISIKDCCVSEVFVNYCQNSNAINKTWSIIKTDSNNYTEKDVYSLSDGCDYLYGRVIQENIKHEYGIHAGNRDRIIRQLKCVLDDELPKSIIRTDIKSFFESIDTEKLIDELEEDNRIQKSQINAIKSIISEYEALSTQSIGVPRGIGISSYLAEKYLSGVDKKMTNSDYVVYYARFVDDIVIITTENRINSTENANTVFELLKHEIESLNLELHPIGGKSSICSFDSMDFDFLGYHFIKDGNKLVVDIADEKMRKIIMKINRAIISFYNKEYSLKNNLTYRKKLRFLRDRLELLSRPVHLLGMTKKTIIGIPVTYSEVTRDKSFVELDNELKSLTASIKNKDVQSIIKGISFSNIDMDNPKNIRYKEYKYLSSIWKRT